MDNSKYRSWVPKLVTVLAAVLISAVAGYNWAISPQTRCLQAAEDFDYISQMVSRRTEVLNKLISSKQELAQQLNDKVESLRKRIFNADEAEEFLSSLETTAKERGCAVESIIFEPARKMVCKKCGDRTITIYSKIVRLRLNGSYEKILSLLKVLEQVGRYIVITDMYIEPSRSNEKMLNCDMNIRLYFFGRNDNENEDNS